MGVMGGVFGFQRDKRDGSVLSADIPPVVRELYAWRAREARGFGGDVVRGMDTDRRWGVMALGSGGVAGDSWRGWGSPRIAG